MPYRNLTTEEIALAQTRFGNSIDYTQVKIYNEKWNPLQPDDRAITPNGNIYFSSLDVMYSTNFGTDTISKQSEFMHEMTHVWQLQQGFSNNLTYLGYAAFERNYNYNKIFNGVQFKNLGIEEQAQFLQDYFLVANGQSPIIPTGKTFAEYQAELPIDFLSDTYIIEIDSNQHFEFIRPRFDSSEELPSHLTNISSKFSSAINASSPLVLDLDGDGIELSQLNQTGTVYWDGDVDGFREASAWVKPDDGLLVRDVNANGKIDNNSELFGNNATYANGFLNLKSLDSNNSNTITSADAQWGSLKVWKDTNQDGVSQSSELYTLSSLGITQINLNYSNSTTVIAGNEIKQISTFVQNGATKAIVDAWFANDQVNSVYDGSYTLNTATLFLPTLRGYGSLPDLHISMSQNSALLTAVQNFTNKTLADMVNPNSTAKADFKAILYKWAGVESVVNGSRGAEVNAKDLAFLEKMMGRPWVQVNNGNDPSPNGNASGLLNDAINLAIDNLYARMVFQAGGSALFTVKPSYNPVTDAFEGTGVTLDMTAIQALFTGNTLSTWDLGKKWINVFTLLNTAYDLDSLSTANKNALTTYVASTDATGHLTYANIKASVDSWGHLSDTDTGFGSDVITGTTGNDVLRGRYIDEIINAGSGHDTVYGG